MSNGNRIKETTTATNTATIQLAGAVASFRPFSWFPANKRTGIKVFVGPDSNNAWLIGVYDLTANNTLTRRLILDSSANGTDVILAAGTKEVAVTIAATQGDQWESGTSTRVVYLSNYCVSDTNLSATAPVAGVDQRAAIQAVLDMASAGPLRVVWDVCVTVANIPDGSGDTLKIRSNTEIVAMNGCGALQAANSTGWMFMNANPTTNQNNNFSAIVDENITINGGIWNGNRSAQNGVKNDIFHWSGIRNLRTENYIIVNGSGMAHRSINTDGHKNFHYLIDFGEGNAIVNSDGMHYHGPARGLRDRGGRILNCGDDAYALNADDAWGEANFTGRFDNVYGPITDVTVEDLYIRSSVFAMRMLSGASRIDDIRVKNVRGSTTGYGFVIDNYLTPSKCVLPGPGNFGNIEIDGWHMANAVHNPNADWYQMSMHINAKVEQLSMRNITKSDFNNILFPVIRFGEKSNIDQLAIDLSSRNYNSGTYLTEQIDFAPGAKVTQADIKLRTYASSPISGYPVRVQSGATIQLLSIDGQAPNFTGMLSNQGVVTTLRDRTLASTVTPPATTWVLQSGSPWAEDTSIPGKLTLTTNHAGVVDSAKKIDKDTFSGNVLMTGKVRFNYTEVRGAHAAFIVRGANIVPWSGVTQGYAFDISLNNAGSGGSSVKLFKIVGGSQPTLGAEVPASLDVNTTYSHSFTTKTTSGSTSISWMMQRLSDGLYLQPNGTWGASAVSVLTATDTSIPAAAGEWGVYAFNDATPGMKIEFTDLSIAAAP